ncbi:MAG: HAMP domain-containing histidine kinase [Bacteroidales bacterium]|nr:HAMP domain-containing histidine kinase [Bacteroidales bacterium]
MDKLEIKTISAQFENIETENRFRKANLKTDKISNIFGIIIFSLSAIIFIRSDFFLFGKTSLFYQLLTFRLIYLLLTSIIIIGIIKTSKSKFLDTFVLSWYTFTIILITYVNSTRPNIYIGHYIIDIVFLAFIYLVYQLKYLFQVCMGLLFTLIEFITLFYYTGDVSLLEMNVVISTILLMNILGLIFSRQYHISRRKEFRSFYNEQKLKTELEKLNISKDKFFSILAHDLRSPFSSILGFSEILHKKYHEYSDEERIICINNIYTQNKRIYELLNNLLLWSQNQRNKIKYNPEIISIDSIINKNLSLIDLRCKEKGIQVPHEITSQIDVYADANMIDTVIRNILSNAVKFTNKGGDIDVNVLAENNFAKLSIRDSGVGIADERLKDMFQIDKTSSTSGTDDEKGTGLGLIICKEFIETNKGKIEVKSELEKGSEFTICIPLYKP